MESDTCMEILYLLDKIPAPDGETAEIIKSIRAIVEGEAGSRAIRVEFTKSQLDYLQKWGKRLNGTQPPTLIRMMVDTMIRINPIE